MSSATLDVLRRNAVLAEGAGALAAAAEPLLIETAGAGASLVSLAVDYGEAGRPGESVSVETWADRATRTLVFAHGQVTGEGGRVLARLSAVLRRGA